MSGTVRVRLFLISPSSNPHYRFPAGPQRHLLTATTLPSALIAPASYEMSYLIFGDTYSTPELHG